MDFEQHAFISYAHIDNEPLTREQRGWVTQFHETLKVMLSQQLGERARIWRDDKLDGSDVFDDEIIERLTGTAILVSVLTPRYLRSDWCRREVEQFCESASRQGGLRQGNRWRYLKVIKTPLDPADPAKPDPTLPEPVQRSIGIEFYTEENGRPVELDPAFGEAARQAFLRKLKLVALSLADSLRVLAPGATPPAVDAGKPVVFLAECGRDLREVRERIEADLRTQGYPVLPDEDLDTLDEEPLRARLHELLGRAALAIHLVGRSPGPVPEGPSGRSLVMLQSDVAAELAAARRLRRIIWLPAGIEAERVDQQAFITALRTDPAQHRQADLLSGDVESLKGTIRDTLQRLARPAAAPAPAPDQRSAPVVHLLTDETDRPAAVPLVKALRAHGVRVTLPVFSGDAAALREANRELLAGCDLLVLFYGAGSELWKHHQLTELRKQAALTGRPALRDPWIALAAPSSADKELLVELDEPRLIDLRSPPDDQRLQPLLAALAGSVPGADA